MKQFDEWKANMQFQYDQTAWNLAQHAFEAGMLAAADIVADLEENWTGPVGKGALSLATSLIKKTCHDEHEA